MRDVPYLMPLGKKDYNSRSEYKPKLGKYFQIYRYQLNFVMFCTTSVLDISWCHLNHPNLLAHSVYRFHVYFHVKIILHHLGISLGRLKSLTLKMLITVFVMMKVLMQMKYE